MSEVQKSVTQRKASAWDNPGTKKWYWVMRIINVMLFVLPLYPLLGVVGAVLRPQVQVSARQAGVDVTATQGEVASVLVELRDPTWLDYLLLAGPWVAAFVAVSIACRALYRIDINFNGNQNPYTERDFKMLKRADMVCGLLMLPVLISLFGTLARYNGTSADLFLLLMMGVAMGTTLTYATKLYSKGKSFYEEMEKGV